MKLISPVVTALVVMLCCLSWLVSSYAAARVLCSSSFWRTLSTSKEGESSSPPGSPALTVLSRRRHSLLFLQGYWWTLLPGFALLMLVFVCGFQTTSAYSSISLLKLVYASSLASFRGLYMRCLLLPRIFVDLVPFSSICMQNLWPGWIVTPKYLMLSIQSRFVLPSSYTGIKSMGFPKLIVWHLFIEGHFSFHWPLIDSSYAFLEYSGIIGTFNHFSIISGETTMAIHTAASHLCSKETR